MLGFDEFGQLQACWMDGDSTCSTIVSDMRGKTCMICGREWELSAKDFLNQYFDRTIEQNVHKRCAEGVVAMREADMWHDLLCELKMEWSWKLIPNEYGGAWNTPWYLVTFKGYLPKLKVGTRKRVYNLDLLDCTDAQVKLGEELLKDESSTKWAREFRVGVHAWGKEEVKKHLAMFAKILTLDKPIAVRTLSNKEVVA